MENPLLDFMQNNWTPIEVSWYTEILNTIAGIHEDWAANLDVYCRAIGDDRETSIQSDEIRKMIRTMLSELLADMGIFVDEENEINNIDLYKIYKELLLIGDNEQIEFMLSILEAEEDPRDIFFNLLTQVGGLDLDEALFNSIIRKISTFTVSKLKNELHLKLFAEIPDVEEKFDTISAVNKIKTFVKELNDDKLYVIELIRQGITLGLPFEQYMDLYWSVLSDLDYREIVYNLYLFSIISSDGYNESSMIIQRYIPKYTFDVQLQEMIAKGIMDLQIKLSEVS